MVSAATSAAAAIALMVVVAAGQLCHDRVPGGQRGTEGTDEQRHRGVPRHDDRDDADRSATLLKY
jgi:hypothetical protein